MLTARAAALAVPVRTSEASCTTAEDAFDGDDCTTSPVLEEDKPSALAFTRDTGTLCPVMPKALLSAMSKLTINAATLLNICEV